jgi:hypothetical protein
MAGCFVSRITSSYQMGNRRSAAARLKWETRGGGIGSRREQRFVEVTWRSTGFQIERAAARAGTARWRPRGSRSIRRCGGKNVEVDESRDLQLLHGGRRGFGQNARKKMWPRGHPAGQGRG